MGRLKKKPYSKTVCGVRCHDHIETAMARKLCSEYRNSTIHLEALKEVDIKLYIWIAQRLNNLIHAIMMLMERRCTMDMGKGKVFRPRGDDKGWHFHGNNNMFLCGETMERYVALLMRDVK